MPKLYIALFVFQVAIIGYELYFINWLKAMYWIGATIILVSIALMETK